MTKVKVTKLGSSVARTGLLPATAANFLTFLEANIDRLAELLPRSVSGKEFSEGYQNQIEVSENEVSLMFVISHLCFSSPEYGNWGYPMRRAIPFPLTEQRRDDPLILRTRELLNVQPWDRDIGATNAAVIACNWMTGSPLIELEGRFERLTGGMVREMLRVHASHLSGLADILEAGNRVGLFAEQESTGEGTAELTEPRQQMSSMVRRLIRRVRVMALQALSGYPEEMLWLGDLRDANNQPLLRRDIALRLREHGLHTIEDLLDGGRRNVFHSVMSEFNVQQSTRQDLLDCIIERRSSRTSNRYSRIAKEITECAALVKEYEAANDLAFEAAVEKCLACLGMTIVARDNGGKPPRFPDFVVETKSGSTLVIECKSAPANGSVDLGGATDVGGKATAHGLNRHPMVTVCQKHVSTDVSRKIVSASDLSVVDAEDFASALALTKSGRISEEQFVAWITVPGQPRYDDLTKT